MNSNVTNKKELDKVLHWSMDVPSLLKGTNNKGSK